MRIACFNYESWMEGAVDRLRETHSVDVTSEPLTIYNAPMYAQANAILIVESPFTPDLADRFSELELLVTLSTGVDHIDMECCRTRHIAVCNAPEYATAAVAEHVFALLLAICHELMEAVERCRNSDFSLSGLMGCELHGKTLGVVGTGRIGRRVIGIANALGMNVVACDVRPDENMAGALGFHYIPLCELLSVADVLTLHVPLTSETRHMLSDAQFDQMKTGVIVINTARGELVDYAALWRACECNKVGGAGLDVSQPLVPGRECVDGSPPRGEVATGADDGTMLRYLARRKGVLVTPHSAFLTRQATGTLLEMTIGSIQAFCKGNVGNAASAGCRIA